MFRRNTLAIVTACAALACGNMVFAADPAAPITVATPLFADGATSQPMPMAPAATQDTPAIPPAAFQGALNQIGIGQGLASAKINIGGYVEGSWTYSAHPPAGNFIQGREFDTKSESLQFDAVDISLTRNVDYTSKSIDFGFNLENMYGWDSAFIHSNGLTIYGPGATASRVPGGGNSLTIHPKAQYDLVQADFTISAPLGYGISFTGGKFDSLMGYETIEANKTPFYSRSFIFTQEPYTHTGAFVTANLLDTAGVANASIDGGITRGWDQSTRDDNGSIDYMARFKYSIANKFSFILTGITGQEEASPTQNGFAVGQNGYRTVIDLNGTYNIADNLILGYNGMYAWEPQTSNGGISGGTGQWYAAAAYLSFIQSSLATINLRGEFLNDPDGAMPFEYLTSGVVGPSGRGAGIPNHYIEATINVNITPFPNTPFLSGLHIRPEGRFDYADHATWNGGTRHDQWTAAVEAYFVF